MTRRHRGDDGTVTLWTLGMVLIVLFVGAISLDLWSGFAARRELASAADQAAQAGANALDETLFRSSGERRLDPARAEALALDSLELQGIDGLDSATVEAGTDQVVVELTSSVDVGLLRLFAGSDPLVVHVRAVGRPRQALP